MQHFTYTPLNDCAIYQDIINKPDGDYLKEIQYAFLDMGLYKYLEYIEQAQVIDNRLHVSSINILELGLGIGLNLLSIINAWNLLIKRYPKWQKIQLNFASIEENLVNPQQILPYLSQYFPDLASELVSQWAIPINGFYKLCFSNINVTIIVGDIIDALGQLHTKQNFFDIFYLNGICKLNYLNSPIQQDKVFSYLSKLAKPSARLSAYSISANISDTLLKYHFTIEENFLEIGSKSKKNILTANYTPPIWQKEYYYKYLAISNIKPKSAIVVGAGIAGANIAYRLANYDIDVTVIDKNTMASGASGNPIGILKPTFSRDNNLSSQLSRSSVHYANNFFRYKFNEQSWWQNRTVQEKLRHTNNTKDKLFNIETWLSIDKKQHLLYWHKGLCIQPKIFIQNLLNHSNTKVINNCEITHLRINDNKVWQVYEHNKLISSAEILIICNAFEASQLLGVNLNLKQVHGQISGIPNLHNYYAPINNKNLAYSGSGYLAADLQDAKYYWCGATYEHDIIMDRQKSHEYNLNNLHLLLPNLNLQKLEKTMAVWKHRLSTRAVCNNHLPIVGKIYSLDKINPIYIINGLSSHGLSWAGICAEIIFAHITGGILPVGNSLYKAIQPQYK